VTDIHEGQSRAGHRFLRMGLVRDDQSLAAYAFADSCSGFRRPRQGEELRLHGRLRIRNGAPEILCSSLCPQDPDPAIAWAKVRVRVMLHWIDHAAIRPFLMAVFRDPDIGPAFADRPASIAHHHAYPGGLLVHSTEVAWRLFREPLASDEKALLVAAALLHDLGKIRCYEADGQRTVLGCRVDHEILTLELLAPHLRALDADWPAGGARLRQLLSWRASREQPTPPDALIELLRSADRLSARYQQPALALRSAAAD
jgi:hypothetical protein